MDATALAVASEVERQQQESEERHAELTAELNELRAAHADLQAGQETELSRSAVMAMQLTAAVNARAAAEDLSRGLEERLAAAAAKLEAQQQLASEWVEVEEDYRSQLQSALEQLDEAESRSATCQAGLLAEIQDLRASLEDKEAAAVALQLQVSQLLTLARQATEAFEAAERQHAVEAEAERARSAELEQQLSAGTRELERVQQQSDQRQRDLDVALRHIAALEDQERLEPVLGPDGLLKAYSRASSMASKRGADVAGPAVSASAAGESGSGRRSPVAHRVSVASSMSGSHASVVTGGEGWKLPEQQQRQIDPVHVQGSASGAETFGPFVIAPRAVGVAGGGRMSDACFSDALSSCEEEGEDPEASRQSLPEQTALAKTNAKLILQVRVVVWHACDGLLVESFKPLIITSLLSFPNIISPSLLCTVLRLRP